jgi:hypothetical protein
LHAFGPSVELGTTVAPKLEHELEPMFHIAVPAQPAVSVTIRVPFDPKHKPDKLGELKFTQPLQFQE